MLYLKIHRLVHLLVYFDISLVGDYRAIQDIVISKVINIAKNVVIIFIFFL